LRRHAILRPPSMTHHKDKKEDREYPTYPRVGIGVLVFKDDQFLLIKRGQEPSKGKWTVPGGLVELGEKLEQAVHREIYEECNIRISRLQQLDIFEFLQSDPSDKIKYHYIVIDFLAEYESGKLKAKSDIDKAQWVKIDFLDQLDIAEGIKPLIDKALSIRKQSQP